MDWFGALKARGSTKIVHMSLVGAGGVVDLVSRVYDC